MKNIWGIFRRDVEKLTESVVPVIVIIGLCLVPCLYAWFNIMSNADPYGPASTSNIKVAVASEDKGSELLGLEINIGDLVMDGIKGNDQMGWCFVDTREEAMEGLYAGDYYAALIVPKDFTKNFMSILDGELIHPEVEYYENEKKNAIAPKITNKAKTAVQEQINGTIVEKVADAVVTVSDMFKAMGLDADNIGETLTEKMDDACNKLDNLRKLTVSLKNLAADTQELLYVGAVTLDDGGQVLADGGSVSHQAGNTADAIYDASVSSQENILNALNSIDADLAGLINSLGSWAGSPTLSGDVTAYLQSAESCLSTITAYDGIIPAMGISGSVQDLQTLEGYVPALDGESSAARDNFETLAQSVAAKLDAAAKLYTDSANALYSAALSADDIYALISSGYTADASSALSTLNTRLATLGMDAYLSDDFYCISTALSALGTGNTATSLDCVSLLTSDLSGKYSTLSTDSPVVTAALNGAYTDLDNARTLVARYSNDRAFYEQTLAVLDADIAALDELYKVAPAAMQPQIQSARDRLVSLRQSIASQGSIGNAQDFISQATAVRNDIHDAILSFSDTVNEAIQSAALSAIDTMTSLEEFMMAGANSAVGLGDKMRLFGDAMGEAGLTADEAIELTDQVYEYVKGLSDDVHNMVESDAFRRMLDILENNPEGLASYLVSPVDMRTVIVYEIGDYGSAMSPYYIMLALFVGSLLSVAMIKPQVRYPEYLNVPHAQRYFGRLLLFLFIGLFQALVTSLGCLYYVKIQCVSPLLFVLGCILVSLNFMMMNYSFSYALDNVGLAASVIIMVIQIAGSGGSYPIHVLPEVFQKLYPLMPYHYGMDLVRECIGGFYQGTYLRCALILLGMCVVFLAIGLGLYRPMRRLNEIIAESKEASGVM